MFSESEIRKGRILASAFYLNKYRTSDQEWDDKAWLALQIGSVWGADKIQWAFVLKGGVWAAKRAVLAAFATPVGLAVSVPVIAGGIISTAIDGEEGFFNYTDFLEDVVTLDAEGIGDKLSFTWDVLALKKGRKGSGGSWSTWWARDFKNKLVQIQTDRDYRTANPEQFTWYKDPVTGWTA